MTLPADYLVYPHRRRGMDHDRYDWTMLPDRKPVEWPGGARIALWIGVSLEWFPLDMGAKPFNPPGGLVTAYPDLRHYTLRDYGNRVGIFRLMRAFDARNIRATAFCNAAVATRYPSLIDECRTRGWEIAAAGLDMGHLHHGGLDDGTEAAIIRKVRATLPEARGWLSPGRSESFQTPDLVAAAGFDYLADWVNDDMPYAFRAGGRTISVMPLSADIDDFTILAQNRHTEDEFAQQVIDHFEVLWGEAGQAGGRLMTLALHPWITGQPYRIGVLERALDHMLRHRGVWSATGSEILDAWQSQQ